MVKFGVIHISGEEMFFSLGEALQFTSKYGWHIRSKGVIIKVEIK